MSYIGGDIGGTNSRLLLVEVQDGEETVVFQETYASSSYSCLDAVLRTFLKESKRKTPQVCCLAVAGPVQQTGTDTCANLTNLGWTISTKDLEKSLQIKHVTIINDFAAIGYGITALPDGAVEVLNPGKHVKGDPIACLGAGTGLGEVYLTHNGTEYDVWSSEGGHVDFAPQLQVDFDMMQYMKRNLMVDRISVERVVSGSGLPIIYDFLGREYDEMPQTAMLVRSSKSRGAAITQMALQEEQDPRCAAALDIFLRCYAAEAGNLAIKTLCRNGLYIAGGIAPKLIKELKKPKFLQTYSFKGRMKSILMDIPVYVIMEEGVGMLGSRVMARRMLRDNNVI